MHAKRLNFARLRIEIEPRGPLLIKSGSQSADPGRPEMEFVRTHHRDIGETVFLPGTSLKGALRCHADRSLRGHGVDVCSTFADTTRTRCHQRQNPVQDQKKGSRPLVLGRLCPNCRTFGSLSLAGRLNISDAYPWIPNACYEDATRTSAETNLTEKRIQVGICRKTGQVKDGTLFDLEVVTRGKFYAELQLTNFQLWQLGLVGALLQEMNRGYLALGFGTARGLGQVNVHPSSLVLEWTGENKALFGGVAFLGGESVLPYGLYGSPAEDVLALETLADRVETTWRGQQLEVQPRDEVQDLLSNLTQSSLGPMLAAKR